MMQAGQAKRLDQEPAQRAIWLAPRVTVANFYASGRFWVCFTFVAVAYGAFARGDR